MELVAEFVYVTLANETLMKQYACNMWLSCGFCNVSRAPDETPAFWCQFI